MTEKVLTSKNATLSHGFTILASFVFVQAEPELLPLVAGWKLLDSGGEACITDLPVLSKKTMLCATGLLSTRLGKTPVLVISHGGLLPCE